ncbi:ATP-binding protein, partial [Escherichia coli]|uniref:ATP-binding protein n=1 Tax=Escherichia coli TaxID=562 RepID=UPI0021576633
MEVKNTDNIATNGFVNVCVYGPSGIGKTSLAKTLNKHETLILNMERGLLSVAGSGIDYVDIFSTADLSEAYK